MDHMHTLDTYQARTGRKL